MIIAAGPGEEPAATDRRGRALHLFLPPSNPVTRAQDLDRRALEPAGRFTVDAGAAARCARGKPAAGRRQPRGGQCSRAATRWRSAIERREIGRGLVAYDAADAVRIVGPQSREIEAILGYPGRAEMVHRDDMVLIARAWRRQPQGRIVTVEQ